MVLCRILLLDGSDFETQVDQKAIGQVVFDKVCEHLSLLEKDYFGCTFREKDTKFWLQLDKRIDKQITGSWILSFSVKYYPTDPAILREELTRYLLFLELRTDILSGRLPCSFLTQALLKSYAVQSQIGDWDEKEHGDGIDYIKDMPFCPGQTEELLEKIAELHRTHRGDSPAVAEMAYLENAKNVALYGVHMYPAKEDPSGTDVNIGVCAIGLLIYKDRLRTNRFCWAKMIKISYKREKFFIKLRPEESEKKGQKLTYKLTDVPRAKQLWRIAMEHHIFFRMREPDSKSRGLFSRAGGFTFTGRTYYQAQQASDQIQRTGYDFTRGSSTRYTSTKSLNALIAGYSTERAEQHIAEEAHSAATLNVKRGLGSHGSVPYGMYDDDAALYNQSNGYDHNAGGVVDQYGNPLGQNMNNGLSLERGYGQYYDENEAQGQGNGYGVGPYGSNWSGTPRTLSPAASADMPSTAQPVRDKYGNVIIVKNYNKKMNDSIASSQDDRLTEHGYETGVPEGDWNNPDAMGASKTTKRTYTTPDGTIVTEYRTERNGVVETHVERRTREIEEYEDDFDYDEALAEAIRTVTDMNPDLAVEKIEIHTKSEETMA